MEHAYIATLPEGFHSPISSPIKTMSIFKKQAKGSKERPVIDLENMFLPPVDDWPAVTDKA